MVFPYKLANGYRSFSSKRFPGEKLQSREVIFGASPGEMFVTRDVANLVVPFEMGGSHHGTSAAPKHAQARIDTQHAMQLPHYHLIILC